MVPLPFDGEIDLVGPALAPDGRRLTLAVEVKTRAYNPELLKVEPIPTEGE